MDKRNYNRINSIKARSTNAVSPNSGALQSSDDILVEIRDDYRKNKKQLERYNKFIDKHQLATISIPFLLSFIVLLPVAIVLINNGSIGLGSLVAYASLGLMAVSLILGLVCIGRSSSVNKIERKMKDLRHEAASYQRVVALSLNKDGVSREELELFQDSVTAQQHETETTIESGGLIFLGWIAIILQFLSLGAISIIASIAALVISIILVASKNPKNKSNGKVILAIWIVSISILFIVAYNNAQQAQQTQVQPSYYSNY